MQVFVKQRNHIGFASLIVAVLLGYLVAAQQSAPNATTTHDPIPTPSPTPAPANCGLVTAPTPTVQNYFFKTCIVAKFAAYIEFKQNTFLNLHEGKVNSNLSNCESNDQHNIDPKLVVDFECVTLEFQISKNNSQIYVKSINGSYKTNDKPHNTFSNSTKMFVTTETGHYYKCNSDQRIDLHQGIHDDLLVIPQLVLSNFAYEAYRTAPGTDFYKIAEECALDSGPFSDGVRIGVGVCLVAFVVIILIAYFVGRRRWSQRSSYESV